MNTAGKETAQFCGGSIVLHNRLINDVLAIIGVIAFTVDTTILVYVFIFTVFIAPGVLFLVN